MFLLLPSDVLNLRGARNPTSLAAGVKFECAEREHFSQYLLQQLSRLTATMFMANAMGVDQHCGSKEPVDLASLAAIRQSVSR